MTSSHASVAFLATALALPIAVVSLARTPFGQGTQATQGQAITADFDKGPYRLLLWERFKAEGDEPYFWDVRVKSDFWRRTPSPDRVDFEILLKEFDVLLGQASPLESYWDDKGVTRLVISQDPSTQRVSLPDESRQPGRELSPRLERRAVEYLERTLEGLNEPASASSWSETVQVFDDTLVPGIPAAEVAVQFSVDPLRIDEDDYLLFKFDTEQIEFTAGDSTVHMAYHGFALVDQAMELVYHHAFLQEGFIETGDMRTELRHCMYMMLANQANEPLVPEYYLDVSGQFRLPQGRPESNPLDPLITDGPPKPQWVPATWLAGRYASMVLGAVAEGRSNPLPVVALGSVSLADTAIEVGGSYHLRQRDVLEGVRDPTDVTIEDYDFKSLRRHLYETYEDETAETIPVLLPPGEAQGAIRIGDQVFAVGISTTFAQQLIATKGTSGMAEAVNAGFKRPFSVEPQPQIAAAGAGVAALLGSISIGTIIVVDGDTSSPFESDNMTGIWNPDPSCSAEKAASGNLSWKVDGRGNVTGHMMPVSGPFAGSQFPVSGKVTNQGVLTASAIVQGRCRLTGTLTRMGQSISGSGTWSCGICPGTGSTGWTISGTAK